MFVLKREDGARKYLKSYYGRKILLNFHYFRGKRARCRNYKEHISNHLKAISLL